MLFLTLLLRVHSYRSWMPQQVSADFRLLSFARMPLPRNRFA